MASLFQFVDGIAASPTVRLDLNSAATGFTVSRDGLDLSPPPMKRATAGTLLTDGEFIPSAAYDNRVLKIPVRLVAKTAAASATALTNLARELNRPTNVLQVQLDGTSTPTFYRTFRAPDYTLDLLKIRLQYTSTMTLEIPAEPFGYGQRVTSSQFVITNDPATGTNRAQFDVTGVTGDVETPAFLLLDLSAGAAAGTIYAPIIAVRRWGTPSNITPYVQAESGTLGTNTTSTAVTGASGGNAARCTFGTNTLITRVSIAVPYQAGSPVVDARGTYRIFARLHAAAANSYTLRFLVTAFFGGATIVAGDSVTFAPPDGSFYLVDLGLIQLPLGSNPAGEGYAAAKTVQSITLQVQAQRDSGATALDIDYIAALPADQEFLRMLSTGFLDLTFDGPNDAGYYINDTNNAIGSDLAPIPVYAGSIPMLTPNGTNRFYVLRPDAADGTDVAARTFGITVSYWPRSLTFFA